MTIATEAQEIYLSKINETLARLEACAAFLGTYTSTGSISLLEAAALQARKAFETVAYAAIAPNKARYKAFRAQTERPSDYRKDYNARAILQHLAKINPDFYPTPLLPPTQQAPGHWHFDLKVDGYLTKTRFESFYDRLGKFLHADNPWGSDKGFANLAADLPSTVSQLRGLLALHKTIVRVPNFSGVWVIEVPTDGRAPHILTAQATGEFAVVVGGS
ncbi:hypothetical protein ABNK63_11560 [Rhodanobacter sp. IGA1.0]|uniref:AbiV family abortive infection protein n=1 Tax=Rhodanobacter sp. IGA1.0 TaxID=3158582 RepID=A0AAU7QJU4_9GAMM